MRKRRGTLLSLALASATCLCFGCHSLNQLPPVDFSAPGWQVRQGQALWKPTKARPELAGELLFATNTAGHFFVQFTKTPFPLATAQRGEEQWQIELGDGDFSRRGRGQPTSRFAWFVLPQALASGNAKAPWQFERKEGSAWRLRNTRTGESLEGYLTP
jgi:hypothetical protein